MMNKKSTKKLFLSSLILCGVAVLTSCGGTSNNPTTTEGNTSNTQTTEQPATTEEKVGVSEITLSLSKTNAKVGEKVTADVGIRPSNATNKEYALASSDDTIAIIEGNSITCLKAGNVTITARSKDNTTKKAEAKLTVLGTDEQGRSNNVFEAEDANIIAANGSSIGVEISTDERVSGTGYVAKVAKDDRIIWGINSSAADNNASLAFRLMGPSGWVGMWDSVPYNFADWFTVKVNGKVINTEAINVEGTSNKGGSADYANMKDVTIGDIDLVQGLNVVTFVISNRYDTTSIAQGEYNGNINTWANIDCMNIYSSKDLEFVPDTTEVDSPEADVNFKSMKLEAEAETTRVYENEENPLVDMKGKTVAEFKNGMNVMYGINATAEAKFKLKLQVAAPYVNATTEMTDVLASEIFTINIDGKDVSLGKSMILGNGLTNRKDNFTEIETGWLTLAEGKNVLSVAVNNDISGYEFVGGLDYISLKYISGEFSAFLNETPEIKKATRFEAEADTTKRVGYGELAADAKYVELIDSKKVEADKYVNKQETTKIIFGVESSKKAIANISMRVAAPYIDVNTLMEDVSVGSLGDLWFNGTLVTTPNIVKGNSVKGSKENFTEFIVEKQVTLEAGKNRIVWEPQNYTGNQYAYLGALDYIEVLTTSTVLPYEVNFWTDRNTYFDDSKNEPIYVTCDKVSETAPNSCWFGLYNSTDPVEVSAPGSLYWYYPTNSDYNSDKESYLGKPCDITKQNPNDERPLISGETGGYYKIVYMEKDGRNTSEGYDITDVVYISAWNDPSNYGGYVA